MCSFQAVGLSTLDLIIRLSFYRRKYILDNDAPVLKTLVWFNDIDLSEPAQYSSFFIPNCFRGNEVDCHLSACCRMGGLFLRK